MADGIAVRRYRFGVYELDAGTGELRKQGVRVRLKAQPFQLLCLFLERPGELLTREEIARELWPDGTFVDYEHGVNSAINRIREALRDSASNPRFVETLARRGYRFIAPVECFDENPGAGTRVEEGTAQGRLRDRILASPQELPKASPRVVQSLFVLLQLMYLGFYVGALANLPEIEELFAPIPKALHALTIVMVTAAVLIPARAFLVTAVLFHAPGLRGKFLRIWPYLVVFDELWALAPFLLLHHINFGVAMSCTALLVYAPFAQRSLVLMGAGQKSATGATSAHPGQS